MDEKNISKSTFRWIFFLFILLVFIIFFSVRLLGARKIEQEKQLVEVPLEKEAITPETKEQKPFTIQVGSFQDKARSHVNRLNEGKCHLRSGIVFLDFVDNLEKIGDHLSNIAQGILGEMRWKLASKSE